MMATDSEIAFQAIVKQYESRGWVVRTIDHTTLRATVRALVAPIGDKNRDLTVKLAATESGCKRLWVDASGEVQETVVPC